MIIIYEGNGNITRVGIDSFDSDTAKLIGETYFGTHCQFAYIYVGF